MPKIISANRLADGIVVYKRPGGSWTETLSQAEQFADDEAAKAGLALARDDVTRNLVVDPFIVDVATDTHGPRPISLRNRIRERGPTINFAPSTVAPTGPTART